MTDNDECLLPFEKIKRTILIKKEIPTSKDKGVYPYKRKIEDLLQYGVININKPKGPTSHQISAFVQHILNIKKSGHSGTLDPKVTGCLPIAINKATRVVQTLLTAGKEYVCIMHVHKPVPKEKIEEVMKSFVGKIKQTPPLRSAVKREERFRKIYYIKILEIDGQDVLFRVGCQAGTYIRKLCFDMGEKLGCGANMAELIRTKAGPFNDKNMVTLQDLKDAVYYYQKENDESYIRKVIKPMEEAIAHLPKIWVADSAIESLCHGCDLKVPGICKLETLIQKEEMVAVLSLKDELIALGIAKMTSAEMHKSEKGVAVKVEKVFMEPGTYKMSNKESA